MTEFGIKELSDLGRVSPRTVHFYIQQGLLPPAAGSGPAARYSEGHLARLRLIRLLQKQHQPLAEIGKRLKVLNDAQVAELLGEARRRKDTARGSALEYIRGVLHESRSTPEAHAVVADPRQTRLKWSKTMPAGTGPPASRVAARSQWERYALANGIELHVERPLSRAQQRQLDRLIEAARRIFEDTEGEDR